MRVVIISNNDWDGLWYQRQQFASMYAASGHEVLYINKTLQRTPRLKDFWERFFCKSYETKIISNIIPENVTLKYIYTLPPYKWINTINRLVVKFALRGTKWKDCSLLITYIPTYSALDIIEEIMPRKWAYVNVHNYNADKVVSDLLKSERVVCQRASHLFGDSLFNINRLKNISNKVVYDSQPGVNSTIFKKAHRGDEANVANSIYYFGGIGEHLNIDLYNELSYSYEVVFIGKFNSERIKKRLSDRIRIVPSVSNEELPVILRHADVLGLFYEKNSYVDAVIPAKIYECISTLKPVIVSGMNEMQSLKNALYIVGPKVEEVKQVLSNLSDSETALMIKKRQEIAESADWIKRFELLNSRLNIEI